MQHREVCRADDRRLLQGIHTTCITRLPEHTYTQASQWQRQFAMQSGHEAQRIAWEAVHSVFDSVNDRATWPPWRQVLAVRLSHTFEPRQTVQPAKAL